MVRQTRKDRRFRIVIKILNKESCARRLIAFEQTHSMDLFCLINVRAIL